MSKQHKTRNRRYRNVVSTVHASPWAILPEKLVAIADLLEVRRRGEHRTPEQIAEALGESAQRTSSMELIEADPTVAPSVAVMDLYGVVAQRMNIIEQASGGTSIEAFTQELLAADEDPSVKAILLHIDSPGGSVFGIPEAAAAIKSAATPVVGVIDSLAASAAYWLASQCDQLVITPSGQAGSIGVLRIHIDESEADAAAGVKHQIIAVPEAKADGIDGPMSEEGLKHAQANVDEYYDMFLSYVALGRGKTTGYVQENFGGGRMLTATEALRVGMVDRIATFAEVLEEYGISAAPSESARGDAPYLSFKESSMNPEIFGCLFQLGMIEITASEEEANGALDRWFAAMGETKPAEESAILSRLQSEACASTSAASLSSGSGSGPSTSSPSSPSRIMREAAVSVHPIAADAGEVMAAVQMAAGIPNDQKLEFAQELISSGVPMEDALNKIIEKGAEHTAVVGAGPTLQPGEASADKFRQEAFDALVCRIVPSCQPGSAPVQIWNRESNDYISFKPIARPNYELRSLMGMSREYLVVNGIARQDVQRLSPMHIAQLALGVKRPSDVGIVAASDGPLYNLTGGFQNILLDAQNVALRRSYDDANVTYNRWMRQGESLPDFKDAHKTIAGELADPKAVPEDGELREVTLSDSKEVMRLVVWGHVFSVSWQVIVNDRLSSFTEIPGKMGAAMRRKQNRLAYQTMKDNIALSDGTPLFDASRNNLLTGAAVPSVETWNEQKKEMRQQKGLDDDSGFLNLTPDWVIAPPALEGTIDELLTSSSPPSRGGSAPGNSGNRNIWQQGGRNNMEPIIEAELSAESENGSDTAWYLAADSDVIDTIEFCFLQGLESPAIESEPAFDRLGMRTRSYQAFAVQPIDFRGMHKHAGA